jgi:hypothetical protein
LNNHGQLGVGDLRNRDVPTELPFFRGCTDVVEVACGGDHTVVLLRNGSLYGFGKNVNGQLGLPNIDLDHDDTNFPWPIQLMRFPGEEGVEDLGPVRHVTCGLDTTYVTMPNGQIRVFGASKYGQTGQGNHGNCKCPLEISGLQGPQIQLAAGLYHALAVGCINMIHNKVRKVESVLSMAWQHREATLRQEQAYKEGKGPPLPIYSPELLGLIGDNWPLELDSSAPPADLRDGGGRDGHAGNRPYDQYAALSEKGEESGESGEPGGRLACDDHRTQPADCEWGSMLQASRIQRVRWLHGGVLNPEELTHRQLRADDSFSDHEAKYEDSEDERYATAYVTDFNDLPWRPPWWLKRNQLYGDDETDRTTFQSRLYDDDYLDQPEDLKP